MSDAASDIRRPAVNRAGYQKAVRVTWIGIGATAAMAVVKVLAGLLTGSTALLADGIESLSDTGVGLAAVIGLRIAQLPPDADHPYGHGKAEVLTAGLIAWVMVMLAVLMGSRAIWQLFHPGELSSPHWTALLFLGGTCVAAEALYRYKMWQGDRLRSAALRAEACEHRKDVYSSAIGLAAVAAAVALGGRYAVLDPLAALVTCGFIAWMAVTILRETAPHLMDEALSGPLLEEIRSLADGVDGVQGTEKLIARQSGLDILVELHVEVDPGMSVAHAHEVATAVRDRVIERVDSIAEVLVHIEPYFPGDHVNPSEP